MHRPDFRAALSLAAERALAFLAELPTRRVRAELSAAEILRRIDGPVPKTPSDPEQVVAELARDVEGGLTAMPSGRFFGWVIGGGLPAAIGADWLTSAWDQNAGSAEGTPAAAAVEQVALRWVLELLDLPSTCSAALVTGAQFANFVCLAAARHRVLAAQGWEVEAEGLQGAPRVRVLVGRERHDTVVRALRYLGFGSKSLDVVDADAQGRMSPSALERLLAEGSEPTVVCAQAGNVNGGAFDPMREISAIVDAARARRALWLHVDGAFGLWARASSQKKTLAAGVEGADSWATDAHKWLNTPYDCGIAIVKDSAAHRRAMSVEAAYLPASDANSVRSPLDWTPELSRRARGFALYAGLRQLGRRGVEELVERSCDLARHFAERLAEAPGVVIMNEVVLNQLVVRFVDPRGKDDEAHTRAVLARVHRDGTCFVSGTTWQGRAAMRISVSNWLTDRDDVEASVQAIVAAHKS